MSRSRSLLAFSIPALITVSWLVFVIRSGHTHRVAEHWRSSLTMVFGSFVAGSTPQGGGAVAFPVFTKMLYVPAPVARTFSLSIQAVGMVVASATILISKQPVSRVAIAVAGPAGVAGFLFALFFLGDPATPFWSFSVPPAYVKTTFTVVLAAMAYVLLLSGRRSHHADTLPLPNRRILVGLALFGFVGGMTSAMTGSGVDVFLFLFVVVLVGIHPRVGVPTSVVAMSMVSTVGFLVLGIGHGQLDIGIAEGFVTSVAGQSVPGSLPTSQYDIFGLWLAAVPVVVWGAPLGAWVVHKLSRRAIEIFVATMALAEVVTTVVFLPDLRSDAHLAGFAIVSLALAFLAIGLLERHRHGLLNMAVAET